jgi:hypothetical protein
VTDDKFLSAFESCRLARKDWTHEAHVRMAWLCLDRCPSYWAARDAVRGGIRKLNAAFAARKALVCTPCPTAARSKLAGYHETITTAFVRLIADRRADGESFAAFRDRNPDLLDRTLSALLAYYSPERLFSDEAQKEFVEPDLAPLPSGPFGTATKLELASSA